MARWLYIVKLKSGWFRIITPAAVKRDALSYLRADDAWLQRLKNSRRFFLTAGDLVHYRTHLIRYHSDHTDNLIPEADAILNGRFRYFQFHDKTLGFPPDWRYNPFTGSVFPGGHWSRLDDFKHGDIKGVWELNRFGFVYTLVRAFVLTGKDVYVQAYWRLIEDWNINNPPNWGPNWRCGQEISFRIMAWCFGLFAFLDHPESTPQRVAMLMEMIEESGKRIAANLSYALSQHNNHSISEPAALWTIGTLFPELPQAKRWQEQGARLLERYVVELIYEDGSFSQHSAVYQRLVLQVGLWICRVADVHGFEFSAPFKSRIRTAGEFLLHLVDEESGAVPYYGQNDGSDLLPLHSSGYRDFRPVVQAVHYNFHQARCLEGSAGDELLLWLFGISAVNAPIVKPASGDFQAPQGGCYLFRNQESRVFARCARFRHRPGHADQLHVDLRWRGINIAVDAGTFSYNSATFADSALSETAWHNTITVDNKSQMERYGRFVFLPWAEGRVLAYRRSSLLMYWHGEHNGYRRIKAPVTCSRGIVRLPNDSWLILDRAHSRREHAYRLHWLLQDFSYEQQSALTWRLITPKGDFFVSCGIVAGDGTGTLCRADETTACGWSAPFYFHREPALALALTCTQKSALFWTLLSPTPLSLDSEMTIHAGSWSARIELGCEPALLKRIRLSGAVQDEVRFEH